MKKITKKELTNIIGGEVSVWVYIVTSAIAIFISGVIEGYTHPRACDKSL